MAIDQLTRGGWIIPYSDGGHLAVEPPARRIGTFYEAVWGDTPPRASEQSADTITAGPSPASSVGMKPPQSSFTAHRRATSTYLIGIEGLPFVKIGRTTVDPKSRLNGLQTGQPMQLSLLWVCEGDYEADLHLRFDDYHHRGEWFDLSALGDPVEVVKAAVAEIEGACPPPL